MCGPAVCVGPAFRTALIGNSSYRITFQMAAAVLVAHRQNFAGDFCLRWITELGVVPEFHCDFAQVISSRPLRQALKTAVSVYHDGLQL